MFYRFYKFTAVVLLLSIEFHRAGLSQPRILLLFREYPRWADCFAWHWAGTWIDLRKQGRRAFGRFWTNFPALAQRNNEQPRNSILELLDYCGNANTVAPV